MLKCKDLDYECLIMKYNRIVYRVHKFRERTGSNRGLEKGRDRTLSGPAKHITGTVCPASSDPFYIIPYYIKWVTTSWTHSTSKT